MSLPSQSSRNATRSSQVHYRRSSSSPLRKFITAIILIAAVIAIWFAFIRPRAATLSQTNDPNGDQTSPALQNENELSAQYANNSNNNTSTPDSATNTPVIIRNSPSRPLPGTGNSDPSNDVQRAINNSSPNSRTTTNQPSTTSTDILDSATQHANTNTRTQSEPTNTPVASDPINGGIRLQLDAARRLIAENNRVQARKLLSQTLLNAEITHREAQILRDELTVINNQLVFSPVADPRDPMTELYTIKSGDSLTRIAARRELTTHWKLISRINQISDPSRIRLGQNIKLVRGPFHAIVDKSAHRLDIFHGSPSDPSSWLYIRSFDVGLGANEGTPLGEFTVSANKLENPGWVNPRDAREQYDADDPNNPIGEFWIGLTGVGEYRSLTSYGIHGTIDPESIGGDESMGCVRLANGDIDLVYELLAEHLSRVMIVP